MPWHHKQMIWIHKGLYIWPSYQTSDSHTNLTPIAPISLSPLVQTGGRTTLPTCASRGTELPIRRTIAYIQFDFSPSSPARARSMCDPLLVCLIPDARIAISGQVRKFNEEAEEWPILIRTRPPGPHKTRAVRYCRVRIENRCTVTEQEGVPSA